MKNGKGKYRDYIWILNAVTLSQNGKNVYPVGYLKTGTINYNLIANRAFRK